MSLYESRLQRDLDEIERRIAVVAERVGQGLDNAVRGLLEGDVARSYQVVLDDKFINRETRALDTLCHAFVAKHYPAAGHLRFVSSVLRLDIELERLGDYAVNIARESVQLSAPPPKDIVDDIKLMSSLAQGFFTRSMTAWRERNADQARALMPNAAEIEKMFSRMFKNLLQEDDTRPLKDLFGLLDICKNLERVGSQSKNICEETVFTVTGETKEPKVYRVLFLDSGNSRWSPLAEAFARKAFPESGAYSSAGWAPAEALDDDVLQFADVAGLDLDEQATRSLDGERGQLSKYHVIVALEPGALDQLSKIPFDTVFLEWPQDGADLKGNFMQICAAVRDLMETLRGEGAS